MQRYNIFTRAEFQMFSSTVILVLPQGDNKNHQLFSMKFGVAWTNIYWLKCVDASFK